MEGYQKKGRREREEVFSRAVKAGKRTYFFDVKTTRNDDHYLTITESKRRYNEHGRFRYEKHKLFLYKEDFSRFKDALHEVMNFIDSANEEPEAQKNQDVSDNESSLISESDDLDEKKFTDISFDDLDE